MQQRDQPSSLGQWCLAGGLDDQRSSVDETADMRDADAR